MAIYSLATNRDNVARFGLDRVACTLEKKARFNASTFALEKGPVISMNYALEPILKHFNRYLLHYFCTQEMAGPMRQSRPWRGIVPTLLHFWSDVVVTALTRSPTILYEEDMAVMAHRLTADQLDFIVMHELGHVALDSLRSLLFADPLKLNLRCTPNGFADYLSKSASGVVSKIDGCVAATFDRL